MKLLATQAQLIVRNEDLITDLSIDKRYIIYSGLGHVVLKADLLKEEQPEILEKIKKDGNCFFRISMMEDLKENKNEVRCYLSKDLKIFKAKKIETEKLFFLGIDFTLITLEEISKSKNFQGVSQYRCEIKNLSIDKDGNIVEEILWEKTKYGNIENFLPKDLSKYKPFVKSNRKKLYFKKRSE